MGHESLCIAFTGNPNCGKTTLFNAYTGSRLKTANWPGVTVEKKEGSLIYRGRTLKLVDLPGIYALSSYTMEETLTRDYLLGEEADVVIHVADASSLERSLYLSLQLIELGKPVVLALNMMDIVQARGMELDFHRLSALLGVPAVPVSARKRTGLDALMEQAVQAAERLFDELPCAKTRRNQKPVPEYNAELEEKLSFLEALLVSEYPVIANPRWHALKYLEQDTRAVADYPIRVSGLVKRSYESDIIRQKYDWIESAAAQVLLRRDERRRWTDRIDSLLIHRRLGIPIFLAIMALVFFLTFTVGDWLKGYFESGIAFFSNFVVSLLETAGTGPLLTSLIADGVIAGVGGILTFLPNLILLFLALAVLEDSGYMARAAYLMDGLMGRISLSGRAFIPMLLGFGCTVPAVLASRTLENRADRLKTILITPFMSCSARLPVYILLSQVFFREYAMFAAYSMYVTGLAAAVLVALVAGKTGKGLRTGGNSLIMELPEYKLPNRRTVRISVWERTKEYLVKAGTTIFLASIVLWALLNFGVRGAADNVSESFAAGIGRALEPVMKPAGLGYWQIIVALISGVAAKEVVASSIGVVFAIPNIASEAGMAALELEFSQMGFTWLNAYSMMLFCLLYIPCVAALAAIRKETGSLRFTLAAAGVQTGTAWLVSTLFYQAARLIVSL